MDAHKLTKQTERSYATDSGFYVGDVVELPDGRIGCIDEIILRNVNFKVSPHYYENLTVVRLDDEYWLDRQLTRIA